MSSSASMQPSPSTAPTHRGILFMVIAVTAFAFMDSLAKLLAENVSIPQILLARFTGQVLILLVIYRGTLWRFFRTRHPVLQLLRSGCQLGAVACFFIGLKTMGLAEATAVADLSPILITLGAAVLLKEHVGPRRLLGIIAALIGALMIIRPGSDVFSYSSLWPLGTALCLSGYALITRFIGDSEPPQTALLYSGVIGVLVFAVLAPLYWHPPGGSDWLLMGALSLVGSLGQFMLIRAYASAKASVIAPFTYAGLISALFWGLVLFGEWPDMLALTGALVIAGAGLYVWHREHRA